MSIADVPVKLPNPKHAVVETVKLRDYCLNPQHPRGRHKARVFVSALGLTMDDAESLQTALLAAASSAETTPGEHDAFGARYVRLTVNPSIELLDVVALLEDLPDRGLARGQLGTVVEELAPAVFEVEFSDDEGRT